MATLPTVTAPHQTSPGFGMQLVNATGGGAGVAGPASTAAPATEPFIARSSKVYAVSLLSSGTVKPAWLVSPGALFGIRVHFAG